VTNPNDTAIDALRTAVGVSPENEPLVQQLIKLLVELLRYDEAEQVTQIGKRRVGKECRSRVSTYK